MTTEASCLQVMSSMQKGAACPKAALLRLSPSSFPTTGSWCICTLSPSRLAAHDLMAAGHLGNMCVERPQLLFPQLADAKLIVEDAGCCCTSPSPVALHASGVKATAPAHHRAVKTCSYVRMLSRAFGTMRLVLSGRSPSCLLQSQRLFQHENEAAGPNSCSRWAMRRILATQSVLVRAWFSPSTLAAHGLIGQGPGHLRNMCVEQTQRLFSQLEGAKLIAEDAGCCCTSPISVTFPPSGVQAPVPAHRRIAQSRLAPMFGCCSVPKSCRERAQVQAPGGTGHHLAPQHLAMLAATSSNTSQHAPACKQDQHEQHFKQLLC